MKKDEILNASRKEHRNKDLAEMEVVYQAGSHASRVGALVCCLLSLLSSVLAHTMIYSPWVIYFSIIATQWLVRFIKMKRKSDLVLTVLFFVLSILAFVGFVNHLLEVRKNMKEQLQLKNHLKEVRTEANLSQAQLAEMVGVSRNTISSIETEQFNPTAKLALILCIALDKKFEELFYF